MGAGGFTSWRASFAGSYHGTSSHCREGPSPQPAPALAPTFCGPGSAAFQALKPSPRGGVGGAPEHPHVVGWPRPQGLFSASSPGPSPHPPSPLPELLQGTLPSAPPGAPRLVFSGGTVRRLPTGGAGVLSPRVSVFLGAGLPPTPPTPSCARSLPATLRGNKPRRHLQGSQGAGGGARGPLLLR